jgi:hypothetical protein
MVWPKATDAVTRTVPCTFPSLSLGPYKDNARTAIFGYRSQDGKTRQGTGSSGCADSGFGLLQAMVSHKFMTRKRNVDRSKAALHGVRICDGLRSLAASQERL